MNTSSRLSPIPSSSWLSSCPARPTNGRPWRSSSAPGASPTNIRSASALPGAEDDLGAPGVQGAAGAARRPRGRARPEPRGDARPSRSPRVALPRLAGALALRLEVRLGARAQLRVAASCLRVAPPRLDQGRRRRRRREHPLAVRCGAHATLDRSACPRRRAPRTAHRTPRSETRRSASQRSMVTARSRHRGPCAPLTSAARRDPPRAWTNRRLAGTTSTSNCRPSGISMRELERDLPTDSATIEPRGARLPRLPRLAIVGAGRVGGSLAAAAQRSRAERPPRRPRGCARSVPRRRGRAPLRARRGDRRARPRRRPPRSRRSSCVGHTSGATGLDALAAARVAGARTFSLHPLQTVPDAGADLTGCPCAISGSDPEALRFAGELAERLGMRPFEVAEERPRRLPRGRLRSPRTSSSRSRSRRPSCSTRPGSATPASCSRPSSCARPRTGPSAAPTRSPARSPAATRRRSRAIARRFARRRPSSLALYDALAERTRTIAARQTDERETGR